MERHNAVFLEKAVSDSNYHIYKVGWFPGMVYNAGIVGGVQGELYEVTQECLAALDKYEGVPHLFTRAEIHMADCTSAIAYLYAHSFDSYERFEEGLWQES